MATSTIPTDTDRLCNAQPEAPADTCATCGGESGHCPDCRPADDADLGPDPVDAAWLAERSATWDAPAPGEPRLDFATWLEARAALLRSFGSAADHWLAGKVDELAGMARFTRAKGPAELDDRLAVLAADA